MNLLQSDEPRLVVKDVDSHVVILTDACYERDSRTLPCGVGGVFVNPFLVTNSFFLCVE